MARMVEKACLECGKTFQDYASQKRKYCSSHCAAVDRMRRLRAEGRYVQPQKPRRGTETPCKTCGKMVYANRGERAKGIGQYCSKACHNVAQTQEPVIKDCAHCGKTMRLKPSQAGRQFCSKTCEMEAKTLYPLDWLHNGKRARKNAAGYVLVYEPSHPNKSLHGWHPQHRLIVEAVLGRYLTSYEHVHHINGIKDDNRIDNLQVLHQNDHAVVSAREMWDSINRQRAELEAYRRRYGPLEPEDT